MQRARKAVVVVDVVESVRLMQQHEDHVIDCWRRFVDDVATHLLPMHAGRLVKSLGDGMLLDFHRVTDAAAVAMAVHRRIQSISPPADGDARLRLRCGVHVCDVVVDERDIYGAGVNLTARLATLAEPGETVVSQAARDEMVVGLDGQLEDMGECFVKHLDEPVHAFRLLPVEPLLVSKAPSRYTHHDMQVRRFMNETSRRLIRKGHFKAA